MYCNNKHCMWNAFDQCCPEDEETYKNATPNRLDCPSSLRGDFQEQLYTLAHEISEFTYERNFKELMEVKKFMESQRNKEE